MKDIYNPSDKDIEEILVRDKETQRVYHYTSVDAFFKIIESVKDGCFTFRAGSVYTMNDRQEMLLGYQALKKYLPEVETEMGITKENSLLNLLKDKKKNHEVIDQFGSMMIHNDNTNFVVSFSDSPDILPMWALYGDSGKGICLEFSPYTIEKYYKEKFKETLNIDKCVYTDDEIEEKVKCEIKIVLDSFTNLKDDEKKDSLTKMKYLAVMCGIIAVYVKHKGFEYEKELRMNIIREKKEWKLGETRYNQHKVYAEVPIPIEALKDVIVGPAAKYDDTKNPIVLALRAKGLIIEPKKSTIPFRLY